MPVNASDRSAQHNGSAASRSGAELDGMGADHSYRASHPGDHRSLAHIRADVARWFSERGFSADTAERAVLLVSELCSNAVEAGPDHPIELHLAAADGTGSGAVVTVSNTTLGNVPPPQDRWIPSDPLAPRGRGLAIVDALSDQVRVDTSVPGRITVVAHISG